eukprot:11258180-Prorocentrum_lima.AAC.1
MSATIKSVKEDGRKRPHVPDRRFQGYTWGIRFGRAGEVAIESERLANVSLPRERFKKPVALG